MRFHSLNIVSLYKCIAFSKWQANLDTQATHSCFCLFCVWFRHGFRVFFFIGRIDWGFLSSFEKCCGQRQTGPTPLHLKRSHTFSPWLWLLIGPIETSKNTESVVTVSSRLLNLTPSWHPYTAVATLTRELWIYSWAPFRQQVLEKHVCLLPFLPIAHATQWRMLDHPLRSNGWESHQSVIPYQCLKSSPMCTHEK